MPRERTLQNRATAEEREWLDTLSKKDRRSLRMPDSPRQDARTRDALLVEQGSAEAARGADVRRSQARDNERVRETSRRRPFKRLPEGLATIRFDRDVTGVWLLQSDGPAIAIVLRDHERDDLVRVDAKLAREARALRELCDVEAYVAGQPLTPRLTRMIIPRIVADAVAAATGVLDRAWISILVDLARGALLERVRAARKAVPLVDGLPRPATSAADVHDDLAYQVGRLGRELPPHVDVALVEGVLARLAVGRGRGGPKGRLTPEQMRKKLARTKARAAGPNSRSKTG